MKSIWKSLGKAYAQGIHALLALALAGLCAQLATILPVMLISRLLVGRDPAHEGIVAGICYVMVGLPVFGALFSRAYSPAEPDGGIR